MADKNGDAGLGNGGDPMAIAMPSLADIQHWTGIFGQAQQMLLEHVAAAPVNGLPMPDLKALFGDPAKIDAGHLADLQGKAMLDGVALLSSMMKRDPAAASLADKDKRFSADAWRETPIFDLIRQAYLLMCEHWLGSIDAIEGIEPRDRDRIRFVMRTIADALSPANFPLTNPLVLARTFETQGQNLLRGLEHMLSDLAKGQMTQTNVDAFEIGRNIAATPGKVVHETPLYQLIHYAPATAKLLGTPLLIFPPWINRFYILDLNARNSFVRWAVESGLSVFMVSWKSADASMADVMMDDYVIGGQIDAIDKVRELVGVDRVHTIGYCVAGTALAMTLAYLAATGGADKVASATFFTAQVDFSEAGDLTLLVGDEQIAMISAMAADGVIDGRLISATFNLLRSRDLIWNYVVQNYLLGEDYSEFDLLYWNGDTTNLPAKWHKAYLEQLYRDNLLVQPGAIAIGGVPIDLTTIRTPAYVQAGRDDHIAPAISVWKLTRHLAGPIRFMLAGSGHIAGVVNPPVAQKYQYWTNDGAAESLEQFVAGATETKGSWWPDWRAWIGARSAPEVPAKGKWVPGRKAIEDAPGRYVRMR
jgi:polyhydroxyalkanoate synthase